MLLFLVVYFFASTYTVCVCVFVFFFCLSSVISASLKLDDSNSLSANLNIRRPIGPSGHSGNVVCKREVPQVDQRHPRQSPSRKYMCIFTDFILFFLFIYTVPTAVISISSVSDNSLKWTMQVICNTGYLSGQHREIKKSITTQRFPERNLLFVYSC